MFSFMNCKDMHLLVHNQKQAIRIIVWQVTIDKYFDGVKVKLKK
jgi:hypothetical protein